MAAAVTTTEDARHWLTELVNKSGVYIISPTCPKADTTRFLIKIGMSEAGDTYKGLAQRLDSYLLYYPKGFHIIAVLVTASGKAEPTERKLQSFLRGKNYFRQFSHGHGSEWFFLSRVELRALLKTVLPQMHTAAQYQFHPPWRFQGVNGVVQVKPRSLVKPMPLAERRAIDGKRKVLDTLPRPKRAPHNYHVHNMRRVNFDEDE